MRPSHTFMDLSKEADATNRVSTENLTSLTSCWWPVIRAVNNDTHISDYSSMKQECYHDVWYDDDDDGSGAGGGDDSSGSDNDDDDNDNYNILYVTYKKLYEINEC